MDSYGEIQETVEGYVDLEAEESPGDECESFVAGEDLADDVGEQSTASTGSAGPPQAEFSRTATLRQGPVPTISSGMNRAEANAMKRRRPGIAVPNNSPARTNVHDADVMADDEGGPPSRRRRRGQTKN